MESPPVVERTAPILIGPVHQQWRVESATIAEIPVAVLTAMSTNCTMQLPLDREGAHALIEALEARFPRLTIAPANAIPHAQGAPR